MLSYAFQVLSQNGYKSIATEDFRNIADMFTAILNKGIESQIKRYLYRDYKEKTEELSTLRGSIKVTESINQMSFFYKRFVCSFDEFSVDSYMNRILKSTMIILLKADVSPERKKSLKTLLPYFNGVQVIDINRINWKFHFNQNNQINNEEQIFSGNQNPNVNQVNNNTSPQNLNNNVSNENNNEQPVENIQLENNEDILDNIAESNTIIAEQPNQDNNINIPNENMDPFASAKLVDTVIQSSNNQNNNIENNNNNNNLQNVNNSTEPKVNENNNNVNNEEEEENINFASKIEAFNQNENGNNQNTNENNQNVNAQNNQNENAQNNQNTNSQNVNNQIQEQIINQDGNENELEDYLS